MSEEKKTLTEQDEILKTKNTFDLDDSWLDELDDLDDETFGIKEQQEEKNTYKPLNVDPTDNTWQDNDKSANDFLNALFGQTKSDPTNENSKSEESDKDFEEFEGVEIVDIETVEKEDANKLDEYVEESKKEKGFNLDDLIKKYEEKYNLNTRGQTASFNATNTAPNNNFYQSVEQIKNNTSISEEEKDNRLAQNYVNKLPVNDRKTFETFNNKEPQKIIVPPIKPADEDEFNEFRQNEQNYHNNQSTKKISTSSTTCKERIGKFTKISGFSIKYLIFLIILLLITIGAGVYLYLSLFTDLLS